VDKSLETPNRPRDFTDPAPIGHLLHWGKAPWIRQLVSCLPRREPLSYVKTRGREPWPPPGVDNSAPPFECPAGFGPRIAKGGGSNAESQRRGFAPTPHPARGPRARGLGRRTPSTPPRAPALDVPRVHR